MEAEKGQGASFQPRSTSPHPARRPEERSRFPVDDGIVFFQAHGLAPSPDLEHLAFADILYGTRGDADERGISCLREQHERAGKQVVPRADGHIVPMEGVDGRLAVPEKGSIHHVIVDEGGDVYQLDCRGGLGNTLPAAPAIISSAVGTGMGRKQHHGRAEAFPRGCPQGAVDLPQLRHRAFREGSGDDALHVLHLFPDWPVNILERRHGATRACRGQSSG